MRHRLCTSTTEQVSSLYGSSSSSSLLSIYHRPLFSVFEVSDVLLISSLDPPVLSSPRFYFLFILYQCILNLVAAEIHHELLLLCVCDWELLTGRRRAPKARWKKRNFFGRSRGPAKKLRRRRIAPATTRRGKWSGISSPMRRRPPTATRVCCRGE